MCRQRLKGKRQFALILPSKVASKSSASFRYSVPCLTPGSLLLRCTGAAPGGRLAVAGRRQQGRSHLHIPRPKTEALRNAEGSCDGNLDAVGAAFNQRTTCSKSAEIRRIERKRNHQAKWQSRSPRHAHGELSCCSPGVPEHAIEAMNFGLTGVAEQAGALGLSHALCIWRDRLGRFQQRNGLASLSD